MAGGIDLTRKIGPLPVWAYGLLGGAAGFVLWRRHQAAAAAAAGTSTDTSTSTDTTGTPAGATDATGGGYTGGYSDGSSGYDNAVSTNLGQELANIDTALGTINTSVTAVGAKLPGASTSGTTPIAGAGGVIGGSPALKPVKLPVVTTKPPAKVTPVKAAPKRYPINWSKLIPMKAGYDRIWNYTADKWEYVPKATVAKEKAAAAKK